MNRLEQIVFSLPPPWDQKAMDAETDGYTNGYCGSIEVIEDYIRTLESKNRVLLSALQSLHSKAKSDFSMYSASILGEEVDAAIKLGSSNCN